MINVLSLFDGISCGQLALQRAGIAYEQYFASEIDERAIKVTQANWPNTVQVGDVTKLSPETLPKIDLLIGGSPCQGFSRAGKQQGFLDERSRLFFEFARLFKVLNPKWFLLENVVMDDDSCNLITKILGVSPILIDSAKFSAQSRKRLYWTNIPISVDVPQGSPVLGDILEANCTFKWVETLGEVTRTKNYLQYDVSGKGHKSATQRAYYVSGKHATLRAEAPHAAKVLIDGAVRHLTKVECCRLQTVPDNYLDAVSENQAKRLLGNGWTVDVIAHIFKGMK